MKKSVALRLAAIPAYVLAVSGSAHAALPTEVTAVTAIIVAFVAFWGLKKLGSKLGWL